MVMQDIGHADKKERANKRSVKADTLKYNG